MKKLILLVGFIAAFVTSKANEGTYTIDNAKVDQLFASSEDVTIETMIEANDLSASNLNSTAVAGSRGGYLVRAFFCGGFALHRYYMGAKGALWAMYLCIPVVGGVDACVDFWWVVFSKDALAKYQGNSKYIVWLD